MMLAAYSYIPIFNGFYPLYATSMILNLVFIPYMPTDLVLDMLVYLCVATVMSSCMVCFFIWSFTCCLTFMLLVMSSCVVCSLIRFFTWVLPSCYYWHEFMHDMLFDLILYMPSHLCLLLLWVYTHPLIRTLACLFLL